MTSMMLEHLPMVMELVRHQRTTLWLVKQVRLAVFNPEYTSIQWVIGYTPDVVISHWLGFRRQMRIII